MDCFNYFISNGIGGKQEVETVEGRREALNLSGVWDWSFYWDSFGYILKTVANFLMVIVAIIAVGMLLNVVINAIRNGKKT